MEGKLSIQGQVSIMDADTGKVLVNSKNMVVRTGINRILELISGDSFNLSNVMNYIAIGTDDGTVLPVADTNTTLGTEKVRDVCSHSVSNNVLYLNSYFAKDTCNVIIREAGVFDKTSLNPNATMFSRSVLSVPYDNQTDPKNLAVIWTLTISNNQ